MHADRRNDKSASPGVPRRPLSVGVAPSQDWHHSNRDEDPAREVPSSWHGQVLTQLVLWIREGGWPAFRLASLEDKPLSIEIRPTTTPDRPPFRSVAETARMLGVNQMTVYRAIRAGEFPAVKIRGRYVIPSRALDAMADFATSAGTVVDAADWMKTWSAA